jgi:hypothetical protein
MNGQKIKSHVYAGSRKLATVLIDNTVNWAHQEPVTGSRGDSTAGGDYVARSEFNADGIDVGFAEPEETGFESSEPLEPSGALGLGTSCSSANPNCLTCYIHGFEWDCGKVISLAAAGALQIEVQNRLGQKKNVDVDVIHGSLVTREWVTDDGEQRPDGPDGVARDGTPIIRKTANDDNLGHWKYTFVQSADFQTSPIGKGKGRIGADLGRLKLALNSCLASLFRLQLATFEPAGAGHDGDAEMYMITDRSFRFHVQHDVRSYSLSTLTKLLGTKAAGFEFHGTRKFGNKKDGYVTMFFDAHVNYGASDLEFQNVSVGLTGLNRLIGNRLTVQVHEMGNSVADIMNKPIGLQMPPRHKGKWDDDSGHQFEDCVKRRY